MSSKWDGENIGEIDHYVQQLVSSDYSVSLIKEIILSSIRRNQKREKRLEGKEMRYRCTEETLDSRFKKKLLETNNWYKDGRQSSVSK